MELTAQYLRERFRELNRQYFGGELPEPQLAVSNDDYFNDFPQSRSLRARRETKERYTQTKEEINRKV